MNPNEWRSSRQASSPALSSFDGFTAQVASQLRATDRMEHPSPLALAWAIAAPIETISGEAVTALAGEHVGLTDGRSIWLKPKALTNPQSALHQGLFEGMLLNAANACVGIRESASILKVVESAVLIEALERDGILPAQSEKLGYGQGENPMPQAMAHAHGSLRATGFSAWEGIIQRLPPIGELDAQALGDNQFLAVSTFNELRAKPDTGFVDYASRSPEERNVEGMRTAAALKEASTPAARTAYLAARLNGLLGDVSGHSTATKTLIFEDTKPHLEGSDAKALLDALVGSPRPSPGRPKP